MNRSVSAIVRHFLVRNPAIRECLVRGLINYAALARLICAQERILNVPGAAVACRRQAKSFKSSAKSSALVRDVMAHAHISVVSQINVAQIDKPVNHRDLMVFCASLRELRAECNITEGRNQFTLIFSERFAAKVRDNFEQRLRGITSGLAQVSIVFDPKFQSTPGVVAHIYSILVAEEVNIYEELSCASDLLLVVDEHNAQRVVGILGAK